MSNTPSQAPVHAPRFDVFRNPQLSTGYSIGCRRCSYPHFLRLSTMNLLSQQPRDALLSLEVVLGLKNGFCRFVSRSHGSLFFSPRPQDLLAHARTVTNVAHPCPQTLVIYIPKSNILIYIFHACNFLNQRRKGCLGVTPITVSVLPSWLGQGLGYMLGSILGE